MSQPHRPPSRQPGATGPLVPGSHLPPAARPTRRPGSRSAAHEHVGRLLADWQLLADLSFADMQLWLREPGRGWRCHAQVRPMTGPTLYETDAVGDAAPGALERLLESAAVSRHPLRTDPPASAPGGVSVPPGRSDPAPTSRELVPVRHSGAVVGVLVCDRSAGTARSASPLERAYRRAAEDLLGMVAEGSFPAAEPISDLPFGPRVGDGLLRLNAAGVVVFASPNAQSALRRMGLTGPLVGGTLIDVVAGLVPEDVAREVRRRWRSALAGRPVAAPMDWVGDGGAVGVRVLPLRRGRRGVGTLVLVRDVTDLRLRELQLRGKEAIIREVHHRVKNNLQTVAALLRLQARRVAAPEARTALLESVRRVDAIALVHDTLTHAATPVGTPSEGGGNGSGAQGAAAEGGAGGAAGEVIPFDVVVDRLLAMVAEVGAPGPAVALRREGDFGLIPSEVATPLVLVIAELVSNAVSHGFGTDGQADRGRPAAGHVSVQAARSGTELTVTVRDDGAGLPPGFSPTGSGGLGLDIVRALVDSELRGSLRLDRGEPRGTAVTVGVPLGPRPQ